LWTFCQHWSSQLTYVVQSWLIFWCRMKWISTNNKAHPWSFPQIFGYQSFDQMGCIPKESKKYYVKSLNLGSKYHEMHDTLLGLQDLIRKSCVYHYQQGCWFWFLVFFCFIHLNCWNKKVSIFQSHRSRHWITLSQHLLQSF
jgi:hypothetical protein